MVATLSTIYALRVNVKTMLNAKRFIQINTLLIMGGVSQAILTFAIQITMLFGCVLVVGNQKRRRLMSDKHDVQWFCDEARAVFMGGK